MNQIYDKLKSELINKFSYLPEYSSGKVDLGPKFKSEEKYLDFIVELCREGDDRVIRKNLSDNLEDFINQPYLSKCKDRNKVVSSPFRKLREKDIHLFVREQLQINESTGCSDFNTQSIMASFGGFMTPAVKKVVYKFRKLPDPFFVKISKQELSKLVDSGDDFKNQEKKTLCNICEYLLQLNYCTEESILEILDKTNKLTKHCPYDFDLLGTKVDLKVIASDIYQKIALSFKNSTPIDNGDVVSIRNNGEVYTFGDMFKDLIEKKEDALLFQHSLTGDSTVMEYYFVITKNCISYSKKETKILNLNSFEGYMKHMFGK